MKERKTHDDAGQTTAAKNSGEQCVESSKEQLTGEPATTQQDEPPQTEESFSAPPNEPSQADNPQVHIPERIVQDPIHAAAEHLRQRLSALTAENTNQLTAFASLITTSVPSASEAVNNLIAAYSLSASRRVERLSKCRQNSMLYNKSNAKGDLSLEQL